MDAVSEIETRKDAWSRAAYDIFFAEGLNQYTPKSIFEYRKDNLSWDTFGDLKWGDGFCNTHYDLGYWLCREYLRTNDEKALKLAKEMLWHKAHFGMVQGDEWLNEELNAKGMSFYEKGFDPNAPYSSPLTSHHWVGGFWIYHSITKEQWALDAAIKGTEAVCQDWIVNAYKGRQEVRHLTWPLWNLSIAYNCDLDQMRQKSWQLWANQYFNTTNEAHDQTNSSGLFFGNDLYGNPSDWMQPFMWFGYGAIGIIEYARSFDSIEAHEFLKRMGEACEKTFQGGTLLPDEKYQRITQPYFWYRDGGARDDQGTGELAMLSLPLLKYTNSSLASELERDTVFWRDIGRNIVDSSERCIINPFHSPQFAGSMPKIWGQMMFSLWSVQS